MSDGRPLFALGVPPVAFVHERFDEDGDLIWEVLLNGATLGLTHDRRALDRIPEQHGCKLRFVTEAAG